MALPGTAGPVKRILMTCIAPPRVVSEKSPASSAVVGTRYEFACGWSSMYFSPANQKNVLFLMIGPPPPPPPSRQLLRHVRLALQFGISSCSAHDSGGTPCSRSRATGWCRLPHVHDAAARATHLRIVGVDLHLHSLTASISGWWRRGSEGRLTGKPSTGSCSTRTAPPPIEAPSCPAGPASGSSARSRRLHRRSRLAIRNTLRPARRESIRASAGRRRRRRGVGRSMSGAVSRDRDGLFERADLERDVESDVRLGVDANALAARTSGSPARHAHGVGRRLERRERVLAGLVGDRFARRAVCFVDDRHGRAGNDALRVLHRATHAAGGRLRATVRQPTAMTSSGRKRRGSTWRGNLRIVKSSTVVYTVRRASAGSCRWRANLPQMLSKRYPEPVPGPSKVASCGDSATGGAEPSLLASPHSPGRYGCSRSRQA